MNYMELQLERALEFRKYVVCETCGAKAFYLDSGRYQCSCCECVTLDDFGKVKMYIEEHGTSSALEISCATGVSQATIEDFLRKGRVEIPEGSKYYIRCERCGCSIRYGRYCPDCIGELAGGIKRLLHEEEGEKPKYIVNPERTGKIRFMDRRWR